MRDAIKFTLPRIHNDLARISGVTFLPPTTMVDFKDPELFADAEDADIVKEAKRVQVEPTEYNFTERDVILYNLGIGATHEELQWIYEGDEDFGAIPTFGVVPQFVAASGFPSDWLPDYNPVRGMSCIPIPC